MRTRVYWTHLLLVKQGNFCPIYFSKSRTNFYIPLGFHTMEIVPYLDLTFAWRCQIQVDSATISKVCEFFLINLMASSWSFGCYVAIKNSLTTQSCKWWKLNSFNISNSNLIQMLYSNLSFKNFLPWYKDCSPSGQSRFFFIK